MTNETSSDDLKFLEEDLNDINEAAMSAARPIAIEKPPVAEKKEKKKEKEASKEAPKSNKKRSQSVIDVAARDDDSRSREDDDDGDINDTEMSQGHKDFLAPEGPVNGGVKSNREIAAELERADSPRNKIKKRNKKESNSAELFASVPMFQLVMGSDVAASVARIMAEAYSKTKLYEGGARFGPKRGCERVAQALGSAAVRAVTSVALTATMVIARPDIADDVCHFTSNPSTANKDQDNFNLFQQVFNATATLQNAATTERLRQLEKVQPELKSIVPLAALLAHGVFLNAYVKPGRGASVAVAAVLTPCHNGVSHETAMEWLHKNKYIPRVIDARNTAEWRQEATRFYYSDGIATVPPVPPKVEKEIEPIKTPEALKTPEAKRRPPANMLDTVDSLLDECMAEIEKDQQAKEEKEKPIEEEKTKPTKEEKAKPAKEEKGKAPAEEKQTKVKRPVQTLDSFVTAGITETAPPVAPKIGLTRFDQNHLAADHEAAIKWNAKAMIELAGENLVLVPNHTMACLFALHARTMGEGEGTFAHLAPQWNRQERFIRYAEQGKGLSVKERRELYVPTNPFASIFGWMRDADDSAMLARAENESLASHHERMASRRAYQIHAYCSNDFETLKEEGIELGAAGEMAIAHVLFSFLRLDRRLADVIGAPAVIEDVAVGKGQALVTLGKNELPIGTRFTCGVKASQFLQTMWVRYLKHIGFDQVENETAEKRSARFAACHEKAAMPPGFEFFPRYWADKSIITDAQRTVYHRAMLPVIHYLFPPAMLGVGARIPKDK